MGDYEWHEVHRKKHRSVFQRLKFPNAGTSKADELAMISLSVYVSNFPSHLTVRDLWNICGNAGTLVDVYIAKHRNALGQMFGFCRYIKVANQTNGKPTPAMTLDGKPAHASPKVASNINMASSYVNVAKGFSSNECKTPKSAQEDIGMQIWNDSDSSLE
ncbi:reverse transcriptase domain, reverse transcriptase zinc-binding domain protein [Tanacetum coccineum]